MNIKRIGLIGGGFTGNSVNLGSNIHIGTGDPNLDVSDGSIFIGTSVYIEHGFDTRNIFNGEAGSIEIVNDLTTGGANKALSAEMGKELRKTSIDSFLPISAYTKSVIKENLYNPEDEDIEEGYFLTATGDKQAADSFAISGYIPLSKFTKNLILSVNGLEKTSGGYIAYYNQNKDFISSQTMTTSAVAAWFEGVYYVRFSIGQYKTGNIQIEVGNAVTNYLPYKTSKLKENVLIGEDNLQKHIIGNENIKTKAVDITQLSFTKQNLFNPNDPDYTPNSFLKNAKGELGSSNFYAVSGYIPFTNGQLILSVDGEISGNNDGYNIYYDKNKEVIGYSKNMDTNQIVTWFEGVAFVRFSIHFPSKGNIQIERGNQVTEYIPYSDTTIIPDDVLEGKTLHNDSVEVKHLSQDFDMTKSVNLLDLDSCEMGKYSYINSSKQLATSSSASLMTSGFIKVKPNTEYVMSQGHSYVPFDKDKVALIDSNNIAAVGDAIFTTPDNCEFIVVNMYMYRDGIAPYDFTQTNRLYEGNIIYPYTPYGVKAGEKFSVKYQSQTTALLGSNSVSISAETLAKGETLSMLKKDFPKSIKQNQISFTAKITNWGGGLQIGRGFNVYNSCYFIITDDKIELYKWEGSEHITLIERVGHELSFQEYINIVLSERGDKALLVIQTLTDNFTHEFEYKGFNGPAAVLSLGAALSNCKLSICNPSLKSPLWMFGDSYYGSDGHSRQMYWLKQWGVLNCLVQGYGGQNSATAYQDLVRCLSHGRPKYLVWSLGMNDDNSAVLTDITTGNWYKTYIKVRQLCELNDIELILTTIPEVKADYFNKDAISNVVRNSGLRYIDAAKAVGSNADGEWYGNGTEYDYQSSDNVHPSEYGAKAIATQFLIDFPEIMQY